MAVTDSPITLADGIAAVLSDARGESVTVGDVHRLTGGASRQVWSVEAFDADGGPLPVVLRRDPPGHGDAQRMRAETACLRAAAEVGVPVPQVLASGDTAPGIDAPYLLMNRVDGEAIPRRLQRDPELAAVRSELAEQMGYVLGLIHGSDVAEVAMLDSADPLDAIEAVYQEFDEPRPAVEVGLRWLRDHRPPATGTTEGVGAR